MSDQNHARMLFTSVLKFYAKALANAPDFEDAHIAGLWWDEFGHVQPKTLKAAMRAHMRVSPFFPKVAEVFALTREIGWKELESEFALARAPQTALPSPPLPEARAETPITEEQLSDFQAFLKGKKPYPADMPEPDTNLMTFAFRIDPTDDRMRVSREGLRSGLRALAEDLKAEGWKVDEIQPAEIHPYQFEDERAHVREIRYSGTIFMRGTLDMFKVWKKARPSKASDAKATETERFKL